MGRGNFQQLIIPIIWVGFACIHQNAPSTCESFLPPDFRLPNSQISKLLDFPNPSARNWRWERCEVAQREGWEMLVGVMSVKVEPSPCLCAFITLCKSGSSLFPRFPGLSHSAQGLAASPSMNMGQVPRDANKAIKDTEYK